MEMDRSRRVDIDRVSGRQNRIAGRGEILSQTWRKTEHVMEIHGNPCYSVQNPMIPDQILCRV